MPRCPPAPAPGTAAAATADYIALADAKHTLALSGVPVFTAANRQAAYRFVTLVDVLYEHRWVREWGGGGGWNGQGEDAGGPVWCIVSSLDLASDPTHAATSDLQHPLPVLCRGDALRAV